MYSRFLFLLHLLALVTTTTAVKHGTVGYGINMYHPYCCTACSDVLGSLYLNCTTFSEHSDHEGMDMKLRKRMSMDMEVTGITTDECHASDSAYLQTMAFCVALHCDEEKISYEQQNTCFQKRAAGGLLVPSLRDSLPSTPPTEELAEDEIWLNRTMLANQDSWMIDRKTIQAFETTEKDHVTFSTSIMTFSVAVPLLCGTFALLRQKSDTGILSTLAVQKIQSKLVLPAMFGQRCAQPLSSSIGYIPQRAMTCYITIYCILNIVFCAVPYYSVQPNTWFGNRNQELGEYVANRTGVLSFANMALAILFSSRNNPLIYLSGWSPTSCLTFHRWAARMAIVQAIVHSIIYTAYYSAWMETNAYADEAKKAYFWWGIIATTAMGLMAGLSALPLRRYAYELFLFLHIVFAILSLMGSWYHVELRFKKNWGYEVWLYIAFVFWAYDRLVRFMKVAFYCLTSKNETVVAAIPGTNVISLKIYTSRYWKTAPGQHTFVYFPTVGRFWENHPFSVATWGYDNQKTSSSAINREEGAQSSDIESGRLKGWENGNTETTSTTEASAGSTHQVNKFYIQCYVRAHIGTTASLLHNLQADTSLSRRALTEGPYGGNAISHASLKNADKVLCIAGGIGITWSASFCKQFVDEQLQQQGRRRIMPQCKEFVLAWSVRERELLEHVKENLLHDRDVGRGGLDDGSLEYRFWLTGKSQNVVDDTIKNGVVAQTAEVESQNSSTSVSTTFEQRMDVEKLIRDFMETGKRHVVLVCGPGSLADDVRRHVVAVSTQGHVVDMIAESFAW